MKIAIFENQYPEIEASFLVANIEYFDSKLIYEIFPSSQSFSNFNDVLNYDAFIVDLDLSIKSDLDGYAVIKKILEINKNSRIAIITGSSKVEERLRHYNLPNVPIITKPVDFEEINIKLKQLLQL